LRSLKLDYSNLRSGHFFFFAEPNLLRASFSHFRRFALLLYFLHAFSTFESLWERVNGLVRKPEVEAIPCTFHQNLRHLGVARHHLKTRRLKSREGRCGNKRQQRKSERKSEDCRQKVSGSHRDDLRLATLGFGFAP
jgi:hypothetical protein